MKYNLKLHYLNLYILTYLSRNVGQSQNDLYQYIPSIFKLYDVLFFLDKLLFLPCI